MRQIVSLNAGWGFSKAAAAAPAALDPNWEVVNLPHTWNAIDGQDGGNDYYRGTCCYAKELVKSELPEAKKYYIEFRGANSIAELYVNGEKKMRHEGGYSTWRCDITREILAGEKTLIAVTVDNGINEIVYPQMADFTFYGGLYRDVNLICVEESHFDLGYYGGSGIQVTPVIEGKDAKVKVQLYLTNKQ